MGVKNSLELEAIVEIKVISKLWLNKYCTSNSNNCHKTIARSSIIAQVQQTKEEKEEAALVKITIIIITVAAVI